MSQALLTLIHGPWTHPVHPSNFPNPIDIGLSATAVIETLRVVNSATFLS